MSEPDQIWDPGGGDEYVNQATIGAIAAFIELSNDSTKSWESRTELDSHANMPVVGKNAFVLEEKWEES